MIPIEPIHIKIVSLILLATAFIIYSACCFLNKTIKDTSKRMKVYIYLLLSSTMFVVWNWESCVELQFFSNFDGYNIIFIAWIILILLSIFDVKSFGITSVPFNYNNDAQNLMSYNNELSNILNSNISPEVEISQEKENV